MAYFTKEELETYIGEAVTDTDYAHAEGVAREIIEQYTGQIFEPRYLEEEVRADTTIPLKGYPVQSIAKVVTLPDEEPLDSTYYHTWKWGIELRIQISGQLLIGYNAGWTETPAPIKEVALWIAKRILVPLDKPNPTAQSISTGGTSITFLTADARNGRPTEDDWINSILNQYRRGRMA